jgi:hypothetical protein
MTRYGSATGNVKETAMTPFTHDAKAGGRGAHGRPSRGRRDDLGAAHEHAAG